MIETSQKTITIQRSHQRSKSPGSRSNIEPRRSPPPVARRQPIPKNAGINRWKLHEKPWFECDKNIEANGGCSLSLAISLMLKMGSEIVPFFIGRSRQVTSVKKKQHLFQARQGIESSNRQSLGHSFRPCSLGPRLLSPPEHRMCCFWATSRASLRHIFKAYPVLIKIWEIAEVNGGCPIVFDFRRGIHKKKTLFMGKSQDTLHDPSV